MIQDNSFATLELYAQIRHNRHGPSLPLFWKYKCHYSLGIAFSGAIRAPYLAIQDNAAL